MIRIIDLDSMGPADLVDSNYFLIANTNSTHRVSRMSAANMFEYFISDVAITPIGAQTLIDNSLATYVGDASVSLNNVDGLISISNPTFTLNQNTNATITLQHKTKEPTALDTTNANGVVIQNATIDAAGHITQFTSVDLDGRYLDSLEAATLVTNLVDAAYIQSRSEAAFLDSAEATTLVTNLVDAAYVQARSAEAFLDSAEVIALVDSDYVRARQITYDFLDSAEATSLVTNLVDASYVQSRQITYDFLDSAEAIALIDSDYVRARQITYDFLDSAEAIALIDSDYVRARQITYDFLDSAEATSLVTNLVDASYVQSRQITYDFLDSAEAITLVTNLVDAAYVQARSAEAFLDSAEAIALIDSNYVQSRQITYDFLDSAEAITLVTNLVDAAYIQSRSEAAFLDSAEAIVLATDLVDSAYVQQRANSEYVLGIADSAYITSIVDANYINSVVSVGIDSQAVLDLTGPAYVDITGDSMTGDLWIAGNLYVDSDIQAGGNITAFSSFSDISLKENLQLIENSLEKVENISGYTFNYISKPDTRMAGVIAQEVEKVLPEVVYTTQNDHKAVHYGNMVALLVEAIKELKRDVDDLKQRIK